MCMTSLDNMHQKSKKRAKNATTVKLAVSVLSLLMSLIWGVSCRNRAPDPEATPAQTAKSVAEYIAEGDQLYTQREDLSKARLSVVSLRQARTLEYDNYEAAWKLSRSSYYVAAHTDNEQERDTAFREGIEVGKAAAELGSDKPEGHFWLGANYGGAAEHSTLAGLSSVDDIRKEMEAVLKIDDHFQGGAAYLGLGQLYLEAPKLFGGDYQKAIEYLEKGLTVGSDNALIRLRLAEAYHDVHKDKEAREQLDAVLKMAPNPDFLPEYKEAVEGAKKLQEKMKQDESR
jgi:tetratricopeptide (TPR) repeat protein